ncbi:MAG: hypothetical protein Q4B80_02135 [Aerococcaceae bacterium]|nr:hypothetical protein [Aerococcaceae bacterium]
MNILELDTLQDKLLEEIKEGITLGCGTKRTKNTKGNETLQTEQQISNEISTIVENVA